jgi:methyltransferase (TIGR00027 family)
MEEMPIMKNPLDVNFESKGQSRLAEEMALHRVVESFKPESDRIFYDPYAIRFLGQDLLKYLEYCARTPEAAQQRMDQMNRLFPGVQNSIIARVRYFDDIVRKSVDDDLEQLVILGAGYDTRAYRIDGITEKVRVFEIDHPDTQALKITKIKEIFGTLPEHVTFVSIDFEKEDLTQRLSETAYSRSKKTLFIMEGLICYINERAVKATLSFIRNNSGKGSALLFDYFPDTLVDGTCLLEVGKNMRARAKSYGEPFQFGIKEGTIDTFLEKQGFSLIRNVNCVELKSMYFHGINKEREVNGLFSFAYAVSK